jgi:hypothetical protein
VGLVEDGLILESQQNERFADGARAVLVLANAAIPALVPGDGLVADMLRQEAAKGLLRRGALGGNLPPQAGPGFRGSNVFGGALNLVKKRCRFRSQSIALELGVFLGEAQDLGAYGVRQADQPLAIVH